MTRVLRQDRDHVRLLTLNRPAALNAFDQQQYDALTGALIDADADDDVSVVVVTGAGRAFSAGTDLADLAEHGDFRRGPDTQHGFVGLLEALIGLRKPLVCAVNGLAVGLGATLLGHADLVFIAETELQQLVKTKFAAHAYPRAIHAVNELPKTPSGKIQRYLLRQRRSAEIATTAMQSATP
jgi:enoyl-CoA hydratase/carnithine racemase